MDADGLTFAEAIGRIAELADELTEHPDPDVRRTSEELLDWIDAVHRDGLGRLVEMVRTWRGEIFLEAVARDDIAGSLLAAYGLGEDPEVRVDDEAAVHDALASVRPLVESHGGHLEVEAVLDGVVTVRLSGTCDGCPSADSTLTHGVEAALRDHWPNFRRLVVSDPPAEVDPERAALECLTPAPPVSREHRDQEPLPQPAAPLLQIRRSPR